MISDLSYISAHERLLNYLKILLNGSVFLSKQDQMKSFEDIVSEGFSLFKFLISKTQKFADEYESFFLKYKEIFGHKDKIIATFDEEFNFSTESDLNDHLNYIKVTIKNIFNIDLDNANLEELNKKFPGSTKSYPKSKNSLLVYKNFFNSDLSENGDQNSYQYIEEVSLRIRGLERLNKDIEDGTIYIYKTKPKRNLRIKYLLMFLVALGMMFSFVLSVGVLNKMFSTTEFSKFSQFFSLSVGSFFYFFLIAIAIFRKFKNDNYKYSFQKKETYYIFLFLMIISFLGIKRNSVFISTNISTAGLHSFFTVIILSLLCSIVLFSSIYLVSYSFFNPEKDEEKISKRLTEHLESLKGENPELN